MKGIHISIEAAEKVERAAHGIRAAFALLSLFSERLLDE
jgi:hypothetical protein